MNVPNGTSPRSICIAARAVEFYSLTIHSYYAICIPVHPGRGLGRDGGFDGVNVAPAGWGNNVPLVLGSFRS